MVGFDTDSGGEGGVEEQLAHVIVKENAFKAPEDGTATFVRPREETVEER